MDEALVKGWKFNEGVDEKLKEAIGVTEGLIKGALEAINEGEEDKNKITITDDLIKALVKSCKDYKINTYLRLAHFLAQVAHESRFKPQAEDGYYRLDGAIAAHSTKEAKIRALFKELDIKENARLTKPEDQKKFFDLVYGGNTSLGNRGVASGDGYRFRGRGLIQLTGRSNYTKLINEHYNTNIGANNKIDLDEKADTDSDKISEKLDKIMGDINIAVDSAAYFWAHMARKVNGKGLNDLAHYGKSEDLVYLIGSVINSGYAWSEREDKVQKIKYYDIKPNLNGDDDRLIKFNAVIAHFEGEIKKSTPPTAIPNAPVGSDLNSTN
jgi:predicted chitinase